MFWKRFFTRADGKPGIDGSPVYQESKKLYQKTQQKVGGLMKKETETGRFRILTIYCILCLLVHSDIKNAFYLNNLDSSERNFI